MFNAKAQRYKGIATVLHWSAVRRLRSTDNSYLPLLPLAFSSKSPPPLPIVAFYDINRRSEAIVRHEQGTSSVLTLTQRLMDRLSPQN